MSEAGIDLRRIFEQVQRSIVFQGQAQGYNNIIGVSQGQTVVDLEG